MTLKICGPCAQELCNCCARGPYLNCDCAHRPVDDGSHVRKSRREEYLARTLTEAEVSLVRAHFQAGTSRQLLDLVNKIVDIRDGGAMHCR